MQVHLVNQPDPRWDAYVAQHPYALFFHQWGWRNVVQRTYRHQPFYLMATECSRHAPRDVVGVLPLFFMRSRLFGRFLISVPFGDYAGICADDENAARALLESARSLMREQGAEYLELRHTQPSRLGLTAKTARANLVLALPPSEESLWKSFSDKVRNQVRKAQKSGLTARVGGRELLFQFYDIFARRMRDHGTPVHSVRLFDNILHEFGEHARIVLVERVSQPVGAGVLLRFGATAEMPWAASLPQFFPHCPNHALYWRALQEAIGAGCARFHFGRSPWEAGTFHFKKQWGAEAQTLYYEYDLNGGEELPDFSPSTGGKYPRVVALWKRLPLGVTKVIGPRIIRSIPY